ncbi:thiol-disulfide isomerase/thioredoxin [Mucilaginibacter gracilis]|uniref:Thiol-disulfide isomerase/thioredoxin n=1 Tax=Mucilaginibacter gracilis TaxID=423350 RepID=A0A495IWG6_9SPHI|nr:TlpA disulfide reductase family protein [Mucilaginibacter gracilis]RKR80701.1 thiol-disulfide isomerase/thioredoxin [Mucilaginibacter gracilis]
MKRKAFSIILAIVWSISFESSAQQHKYRQLAIGDNIAETPALKNLLHYPSPRLFLKDLTGKLVIIDFWSTGCPSCIAAIPHLESLQKEFEGRIQIIMIDPWESKVNIEKRVSKMSVLRPGIGLTTLPCLYGDTIWRYIFPHHELPHHVWIDKGGKIIAATTAVNATSEHISQILTGRVINLSEKNDLNSRGYDVRNKGLMFPGDTSIRATFYSGFFKSNPGFGAGSKISVDTIRNIYKRDIFNTDLIQFFKIAAHGTRILFELKNYNDYLRPKNNNDFDSWFSKYCYSYEIVMPLRQRDSLYSFLLQDMNRYFLMRNNIKAVLSVRKIPTYTLKRIGETPIKSGKMGKDTMIETADVYKFINQPFSKVLNYLKSIEDLSLPLAFLDKSNISSNTLVTLNLPKNLSDKRLLQTSLFEQGLSLSFTDQDIKVLVVSDK